MLTLMTIICHLGGKPILFGKSVVSGSDIPTCHNSDILRAGCALIIDRHHECFVWLSMRLPEGAEKGCLQGARPDNSQKTVAASLHLCFELTRHGDSIVGILPGLASVLQRDVGLLHACLPSMALLAHLSPRNTADAIMGHVLGLCSSLNSISPGVRGTLPHLNCCRLCWW